MKGTLQSLKVAYQTNKQGRIIGGIARRSYHASCKVLEAKGTTVRLRVRFPDRHEVLTFLPLADKKADWKMKNLMWLTNKELRMEAVELKLKVFHNNFSTVKKPEIYVMTRGAFISDFKGRKIRDLGKSNLSPFPFDSDNEFLYSKKFSQITTIPEVVSTNMPPYSMWWLRKKAAESKRSNVRKK